MANGRTGLSAVKEKAVALLNDLNRYIPCAGVALLPFLPYWACLFTCRLQALVHPLFSLWLGVSFIKLAVSSTPLVNSRSTSELLWQTTFFSQSLRRKPTILYSFWQPIATCCGQTFHSTAIFHALLFACISCFPSAGKYKHYGSPLRWRTASLYKHFDNKKDPVVITAQCLLETPEALQQIFWCSTHWCFVLQ